MKLKPLKALLSAGSLMLAISGSVYADSIVVNTGLGNGVAAGGDCTTGGIVTATNATVGCSANLLVWSGGYSGRGAFYVGDNTGNGVGTFTLTPNAGYTLTLGDFFVGGWPNTDRIVQYSIDNLDTPGLDIPFTGVLAHGTFGATLYPLLGPSSSGYTLSFRRDSFNGGINDIHFTVAPVPEPSTYALLASGLLMMGYMMRRRRQR